MAIKEYAAKLIEQDATLKEIAEQKETLWVNPKFLPFEMTDAVCQLVVSDADIADAERWCGTCLHPAPGRGAGSRSIST